MVISCDLNLVTRVGLQFLELLTLLIDDSLLIDNLAP